MNKLRNWFFSRPWLVWIGIAFVCTVLVVVLTVCIGTGVVQIQHTLNAWFATMTDPTERGCAYIAIAIAIHALVVAFKDMTVDHIKVELDVDEMAIIRNGKVVK